MNDGKKAPMPKGQHAMKLMVQSLYEHAGRTFGMMGDWVATMMGANFCTNHMSPLAGIATSIVTFYIGSEWLKSEVRKAIYYKQLNDSLGPHVGWAEIEKAAGQYDSWNKKIKIDDSNDDLGILKFVLAHEYSHMLFDLMPGSDRKAIIDDFITSPDYPEMKEIFGKFAASPKDIRIIDEMMAIHGSARYDKDLRRKDVNVVIKKLKEQYADHPIVRDILIPMVESNVGKAYENHPLYSKYSLIQPIASKYDHLGFDRPVTAAKALRKEYMEKLLATV